MKKKRGSTKGCPTPLRRFKTCWYTPLFLHHTPNTFLQVPKDPTGQKTLKFQHKSDNTPTAHCLLSYIHTLFKNQSPPTQTSTPKMAGVNAQQASCLFENCPFRIWLKLDLLKNRNTFATSEVSSKNSFANSAFDEMRQIESIWTEICHWYSYDNGNATKKIYFSRLLL